MLLQSNALARRPAFELFDHTADVGAWAYGNTRAEAFQNAALAMFSLMVELDAVADVEERRVEVRAENQEALLVAWLSELIYLVDAEGLVFRRFSIDQLTNQRLVARIWGERIDPDRHTLGTVVKAITRHMLAIEKNGDGYSVRVIFDI
jgi:SHS2 domain-containing protein